MTMHTAQHTLMKASLALEAAQIAKPVTAIIRAWMEGHPLALLGVGGIGPMLLSQARGVGQTVTALHTTLGNIILWIAGFHAAAGLYQHFFLRDRVLLYPCAPLAIVRDSIPRIGLLRL